MFNIPEVITPPLVFGAPQPNNNAVPIPQPEPQPQHNPEPQQPQYNNHSQVQPRPQNQPDNYTSRVRGSGNGVRLKKGQKTNLNVPNGGTLTQLEIGLGWDLNLNSPVPYDLDASVFLLDSNQKIIGDDWFVFYGAPQSPDGAVRHSGDSIDGGGDGDDEIIYVDLQRLNPDVSRLVFVVTINEAFERRHNFSGVRNAYIRISDAASRTEMVRFSLTDNYANVTSMVVGEVYKRNGQWKFNPVGDGKPVDLYGMCEFYGVRVAE